MKKLFLLSYALFSVFLSQAQDLNNDIPQAADRPTNPKRIRLYIPQGTDKIMGRLPKPSTAPDLWLNKLRSVNGIFPDANGNVQLPINTTATSGTGTGGVTINPDSAQPNIATRPALLRKIEIITISQLRLQAGVLPAVVFIIDKDSEGEFFLDVFDTTTPDDGAVVLVSGNGNRYKRKYDGYANLKWWKSKGDASDASATQNTTAFNSGVAYIVAHASAITDGLDPKGRGRPGTLYVQAGSYWVNNQINVGGPIRFEGDAGLSFAGTRILQRASNKHLFNLTGNTNGGNLAVQFANLRLSGYGSGAPSASIVFVDPSVSSANSLYFDRVWFQGWERFALSIGSKNDDVQIRNCTFDGGFNYAFSIGGDADHKATNVVIDGCTFYGIRGGLGYVGTADGFTFSNNRVFGSDGLHGVNTGFGIDNLNTGYTANRIRILNNTFDHVENVFMTRSERFDFIGNDIQNTTSPAVRFGVASFLRYNKILNNTISGVWSGTVTINGVSAPNAAIQAQGTGVRNTELVGNIFVDAGGSTLAVNIPDPQSHFNKFDNIFDGFVTTYNVANAAENLVSVNYSVTPQMFGAKGDGLSDDTQAFKKAIATDRKIRVPDGNYILTDSLPKNNSGSLIIEGESLNAILTMNADRDILRFTSNASGGGYISVSNISFYAGVNMNSGAAINIRAGYVQKVGYISNVRISRPDLTKEFKYGIRIQNPNEMVVKDVIINGNNINKLIGVELTSTKAAITPTFTNLKVYDAKRGIQSTSSTNPGIEGLKFEGNDFVGVEKGMEIRNTVPTATYSPPGVSIHNSHINSSSQDLLTIDGYAQVDAHNNLFYYSGSGQATVLAANNASDVSFTSNKTYLVGTGGIYGVVFTGTCYNPNISFNDFALKVGDTKAAIVLNSGVVNARVLFNERLAGGNADLVDLGQNTIFMTRTNLLTDARLHGDKNIQSSSGINTQYSFPHGFTGEPSAITVYPGSEDAKNISFYQVDATSITVNYTVAPPQGTNNLIWFWTAKK